MEADDRPTLAETVDLGRSEPQGFVRVPWTGAGSVGYALYIAQRGAKHRDAKTLSGFGGARVVEVVSDFRGDAYRAVYTVRYVEAVYVLHAFQKKSKTGRKTPRSEVELIKQRLRDVEQIREESSHEQ